jgi:hypothetical protein
MLANFLGVLPILVSPLCADLLLSKKQCMMRVGLNQHTKSQTSHFIAKLDKILCTNVSK